MPRRPERPSDRTRTGTADDIGFQTKPIESAYRANVGIAMLAPATQTHGKLWSVIDLRALILEGQSPRYRKPGCDSGEKQPTPSFRKTAHALPFADN